MSPAGIVLKGSGFYKTDNRKSNGSRSGKDSGSSSESTGSESKSSSDSSSSELVGLQFVELWVEELGLRLQGLFEVDLGLQELLTGRTAPRHRPRHLPRHFPHGFPG